MLVCGIVTDNRESRIFYRAFTNFLVIHALLLKDISNDAYSDKDDAYYQDVASVSAVYLLSLV
jgi:hypothetical protein